MSCPRILTKDQIIQGLKAGRTLNIDRSDAPELDDLRNLEKQGLVESRLVEVDEQSSVLKFRWKADPGLAPGDVGTTTGVDK